MPAPHLSELERPPGILPGIPHAGAVVALAAAVFVGTALAAISARYRAELGGWWVAGMTFAVGCWLAVAVSALIGRKLADALGGYRAGAHRLLSLLGLTLSASVLVACAGLAMRLSPGGVALSALPFVGVAAYFWSRGKGVDNGTGVVAGVVLFLICIRLFTMPGRPQLSSPNLAGERDDDIWVMSWNVGGGAPGFSAASPQNIGPIAEAINAHGAHVVCLQEVPSAAFLDELRVKLGAGWRGQASPGNGKATAVLSRIGGVFETPAAEMSFGGPSLVRITSDRGVLNFVSCHAGAGRRSRERRALVDWVLKRVRSPHSKTVVAGDFNIDPASGWSFLRPVLTDSAQFDKATWRAANVLGNDPGFGGAPTASLGRRTDWVVVDAKLPVSGYRVLASARAAGMDHAPVLVRVGRGKANLDPGSAAAVGTPRENLLDKEL